MRQNKNSQENARVAPLFFLIILSLLLFGCTDKKYIMPHTQSYNDVYIPLVSSKLAGINDPDFLPFVNNSRVYSFANNVVALQDEVYFTFQMPHTYVLNTTFHAHMHYSPSTNTAGNVVFNLECALADIGEYFYSYNTTDIFPISANNLTMHMLNSFAGEYSCNRISCIMQCHLERMSADGRDNYNNPVFVHAIDFHVLQNEYGTFEEYS